MFKVTTYIQGIINKCIIINIFNENVKGTKFTKSQKKLDGEEGHWLEKQMGILPNSNNEPDKLGFEQKKESNKISFGDWSASKYLWKDKKITRKEFIKTFGSPNPKKHNRYSWSGHVFPKYSDSYNYAGQRMKFLDNGNLIIEYSYLHDSRKEKENFKTELNTNETIVLAIWEKSKLEKHVKKKFGVNGFYICKKDKDGYYDKICFGETINFKDFQEQIKNNIVYLDSGMYLGNSRNYSQFRAYKSFWNALITEEY